MANRIGANCILIFECDDPTVENTTFFHWFPFQTGSMPNHEMSECHKRELEDYMLITC